MKMFTLSVTWSDGNQDNTLQRPYVYVFDFHVSIRMLIPFIVYFSLS